MLPRAAAVVAAAFARAAAAGPAGLCASAAEGAQCVGDDIRDAGAVASALDCCHACKSTAGCAAWTYNSGVDQHCWVKTACSDRRTGDTRYVSGSTDAPPAPTPAPAPAPPATPHPAPAPPPSSKMPYVVLQNAAVPGTRYPMTGLGLRGAGYKLGQKEECWRYPVCCTKDYCPAINATRDWLRMGGWRIDTGYPFGDSGGGETSGATCGGRSPPPQERGSAARRAQALGHYCDPHGTRLGIEQSGVPREDIFITIKSGSSGPMQEVDQGDRQGENMLYWLGIDYADLYLMHEGDLGTSGHHPSEFCNYPTTKECRIRVFQSCINWMAKGKVRACGVANWELKWLQELVDANVTLPSVVQMKFHLHQSLASPRIRAVKEFCDAHHIVFNGYSPLGRADWTTFEAPMTPTTLEEPVVLDVAKRVGRTPAQVILRWNAQQGIPTNPRSLDAAHMAENLDVFSWALSDEDMQRLGSMPQCNTTRGDAFMEGDPEHDGHENMIGPTLHC